MEDTYVTLKTMADFQNEDVHFYIDAYQRGYRWTKYEVKDLLDDIREFSHSKRQEDNTFYCLQPIILTKSEDGLAWKVIDGQQRLTTLYLIYSFYWSISSPFMRTKLPFAISYNNKPKLQKCLKTFSEKSYSSSEIVSKEMESYEDDIDCHYVIEAYCCICDYFQKLVASPNTQNEVPDMKKIFDNYMKVIWYELMNCDVSQEVSVFSKINMGKIPLTNSELIKALLLKKEGEESSSTESLRMNIAVKWGEIESQLSEPEFWSFLVNDNRGGGKYTTHIDFLFQVMASDLNKNVLASADARYSDEEHFSVDELENHDKFPFYVFNNYVRLLKQHPEEKPEGSQNYIECIWDGVCEYYRMFKDWFKNIHWYHLIGFLIETSEKPYVDQILDLTELYKEGSESAGEGHKDHFERLLRQKVTSEVFGKEVLTKSECLEKIKDLDYQDDPVQIKKVLLLYNLAYLEECKENSRFPFEKFKEPKLGWDIEHINAIGDKKPGDEYRDTEDNERLQWLRNAEEIPGLENIQVPSGEKVSDLIHKIIDEKLYLAKNQPSSEDFTLAFETVINYFGGPGEPDNSIGNLTLLDEGTNRSYKNAVFPQKRRIIINKTMSDTFIPICTRNVFMKGFAGSEDLLKWRDKDKKEYVNSSNGIVPCISRYLLLGE